MTSSNMTFGKVLQLLKTFQKQNSLSQLQNLAYKAARNEVFAKQAEGTGDDSQHESRYEIPGRRKYLVGAAPLQMDPDRFRELLGNGRLGSNNH